jgi:hypothetical protein
MKKINEKPLTNAEKQRRFRANRKAGGLYRKEVWTDKAGFLAKPSPTGGWAAIAYTHMKGELSKLLAGYADWEKEAVYAELLEYAKGIVKKFDVVFAEQRKMAKPEGDII